MSSKGSNRSHVLVALRDNGATTRANLARATGIAPSTITSIVRELLIEGVVVESPTGPDVDPRSMGRRGKGLTLNPAAGIVVGVDFGFKHVRVVLCDLAHNIIASEQRILGDPHGSMDALEIASKSIDAILTDSNLPKSALLGAGVALPGPIRHDESDQVLDSAILSGWTGMTSGRISEILGMKVRIDNDANLAAVGEKAWGAARGIDNAIVIKFHSGIGCGLIINGAVVRSQGGVGEIGHVTIDERGPLCRCGKRGCLDSFASISAIFDALRPQYGDISLAELMDLLAKKDPGATRVVSDAADLVGTVVASACNLLAPQRVVIVGAMTQAGDVISRPIRSSMERNIAPGAPPEVLLGSLGNLHTALGGVAMALEQSDWFTHLDQE